ncbi:CheY-like chemotaxis protein [Duganella sp. 3397]|uniref:response regulator n=1 Tax=Duganella sp. 3397 TaxID=2817732 RepID=UPI0028638B7F|nr:response regulator [Duganella sp. 3397]MDR7051604.1 CheY-like chemotaxis protein [Duganella sp. 3397]
MQKKPTPLPLYAHPTLTVLVDDSDSFLRSLSFQLDPIHASKTFHDTTTALQWLRHSDQGRQAMPMPLHMNFDTQNQAGDQFNVALDVDAIYRIAGQPQRFATPSVLVVDYSMPQMNGLEFCEQVRDLPCKKILFTGAADEKIAVSAFNQGLIDRYIQKSDDHALDLLELEVTALQRSYFEDQSDTLRELVLLHNYHFLGDPVLALQVQRLKQDMGFIEHYLFANPTGIVFLDKFGRTRLMMIATEQGLAAHYEMACDSDAPQSLLDALRERRVLPFFSDEGGDGMYARHMGDNWHRYCAMPQLCQGRETYYWALFDLPPHYYAQPPLAYTEFLRAQREQANAPAIVTSARRGWQRDRETTS